MRTFRSLLVSAIICSSQWSTHAVAAPGANAEAANNEAAPQAAPAPVNDARREPDPVAYPPCLTSPDADAIAAARGAFDTGTEAFNAANYPRALQYWEYAYRYDCTAHAMLKNLALAYELGGQLKHAIVALETYLGRTPTNNETDSLRARVDALKVKLAAQLQAAPAPASEPEQEAERQGKSQNAERNDATARVTANDATRELETLPPTSSGSVSLWPIVPAVAGAAVVGLSIFQWRAAKEDERKAADACPERVGCPPDVTQRGNEAVNAEKRWSIIGAAGGVVMVGSLVWFFLQSPQEDNAVAAGFGVDHVTTALGRDFAGLSCLGHF